MRHQLVLVIDFGGQYSQLIVRRVRELGCYSEMVPWTSASERLTTGERPSAVILSGGPRSVHDSGAPELDFSLIHGVPTLGICYGHQLMAHRLGGRVVKTGGKEYGRRHLAEVVSGSLVARLSCDQVWMSHGDEVEALPTGFVATAATETCRFAAF